MLKSTSTVPQWKNNGWEWIRFCSVGMQLFQISHTACIESGDVVFCLQRPVLCLHLFFRLCMVCRHTEKIGGFAWLGRAAVAVYQYSKRTLSKTTSSPVGPSVRQSLFMDAEHASCHFVSPPSLLPSSLCNLSASVQTQIPATILSWHVSCGCFEGRKCFDGDDRSFWSSIETWFESCSV